MPLSPCEIQGATAFLRSQHENVISRFIFSGRLRSGKDYCAALIHAQPISFSQPISVIAEALIGTINKTELRSRRLLQLIGAWGRGIQEENLEELQRLNLPSRKTVITTVLERGSELFPNTPKNFIQSFGDNNQIWIELLYASVETMRGKLAIVNARFPNELETFTARGFKHFHVMCSEATRLKRPGAGVSESDITEDMAKHFDQTLNNNQVIWNDTCPIPKGKKYITTQQFSELYK